MAVAVSPVATAMRAATDDFIAAVAATDPVAPPPGRARETTLRIRRLDDDDTLRRHGWRPAATWQYSSLDPYCELNPRLVSAATRLIESIIAITGELDSSNDPDLAYVDGRRARGGQTIVTRTLAACDPGIGDWMRLLPAAECLQPVAHPWSDHGMLTWRDDTQSVQELAATPALRALLGGCNDGLGVREREAWERTIVATLAAERGLLDRTLRIVSLGTGTGEPAIDAGLAAMRVGAGTVEVIGVDVNAASLRVAECIADRKRALAGPGTLRFTGRQDNLLDEACLARVVREGGAHVYEAVGFAEYVPSDHATDPTERRMRERMARRGLLSAEDFYRTIYDNMPRGSTLLTGNMRHDSPQRGFVTSGLGWPSLVLRSTEQFLGVLVAAGIPGDAVQLSVPGPGSSGVYNLVRVTRR